MSCLRQPSDLVAELRRPVRGAGTSITTGVPAALRARNWMAPPLPNVSVISTVMFDGKVQLSREISSNSGPHHQLGRTRGNVRRRQSAAADAIGIDDLRRAIADEVSVDFHHFDRQQIGIADEAGDEFVRRR
jgi:hypothetical protein